MELHINSQGDVRCLYAETIPLGELGTLQITRASHVEPDALGRWWAELSPVGGPKLGPFVYRSEALEAERMWLEAHLPELDQ
jgi:hypothetical protein